VADKMSNKIEFRCDICDRDFNSEVSLNQHNLSKHVKVGGKVKINYKKYVIFAISSLIVLFLFLSVNAFLKKPGQYDEFAKCLTEKGVVVYGNDFCSYTGQQLNYFGKSEKYLNYIKCVSNKQLCNQKDIQITPTWEINGEMYEQIQTFERLSTLTGCEI